MAKNSVRPSRYFLPLLVRDLSESNQTTMDTRGLTGRLLVFNLFCILLACPTVLFASAPVASPVDLPALYGYLYIGDNVGGIDSSKLKSVNYKGGGPPEWGIGIGRYFTSAVSVEGTFEYWGERYERQGGAVIPGTENNVIQVGGLGLSISAIYNYTSNPFHGYLGVGAGYFLTGILVAEPGTGLLGVEGAPSDKLLPGYHAVIGLDYRVKGNHKLGEIKQDSHKLKTRLLQILQTRFLNMESFR